MFWKLRLLYLERSKEITKFHGLHRFLAAESYVAHKCNPSWILTGNRSMAVTLIKKVPALELLSLSLRWSQDLRSKGCMWHQGKALRQSSRSVTTEAAGGDLASPALAFPGWCPLFLAWPPTKVLRSHCPSVRFLSLAHSGLTCSPAYQTCPTKPCPTTRGQVGGQCRHLGLKQVLGASPDLLPLAQ